MKPQKRIKAWTRNAMAAVNEKAISIGSEKDQRRKLESLLKKLNDHF